MKTYKLTLIGNPVKHSKSPWVHAEFAKQSPGLAVSFTKTESPLDGFVATVLALKAQGFQGANVTLPFKEEAYQRCDTCSDRAKVGKAVNLLLFSPDGKIHGDNVDGVGLVTDIQVNHSYSLKNKNILVLGAGGAVRGILYPIIQCAPQNIIIANRTMNKAIQIANEFSNHGISVVAQSFDTLKNNIDVIIDGTSFDSWPLPINDAVFSQCELVYDLKYGDKPMPIVEKAKMLGIKHTLDGFGMLIEQAAESFYQWTGFRPQTQPVFEEAKRVFGR